MQGGDKPAPATATPKRSAPVAKKKTGTRPEKYRNHHYVDAVRELIKEKAKGHVTTTAEEPAS